MKLSTNTVADIVKAIEQTAERLAQTTDEAVLTDLYIRVNPADGVLTICDDDDRQLAACTVGEWGEREHDVKLHDEMVKCLRRILEDNRTLIDKISILRPYSFVLEDNANETTDDIYLVDDDTFLISGELMEGLDDDLSEFLKKLMND